MVGHGESVTCYMSVECSEDGTCPSQTAICNDGYLSIHSDYQDSYCSPGICSDNIYGNWYCYDFNTRKRSVTRYSCFDNKCQSSASIETEHYPSGFYCIGGN